MVLSEDLLRQSEQRARQTGIATATEVAGRAMRGMETEAAVIPAPAALPSRAVRARRSPPMPMKQTINDLNKRRQHLAFGGAQPSDKELERMINGDDLVDEFFLHRAIIAAMPVCRLVVRNPSGHDVGFATGFMVSPDLLLTNWHVFGTSADAVHSIAEFGYTLDLRGDPLPSFRFALQPDRFFYSNKELDYALVAVNTHSLDGSAELGAFGYHRLIEDPNKVWEGEWVTIIQHPNGDRRQYAIRDNLVIHKQAGDPYMWYQSDTAPGSSGAPAFNDSFQVVALHHMGKAKRDDEGLYVLRNGEHVRSLDGVDETLVEWVANEGSRVSALCKSFRENLNSQHPLIQQFFAAIDQEGEDIMSSSMSGKRTGVVQPNERSAEAVQTVTTTSGSAGIVIPIQLRINVELGSTVSGTPSSPTPAADNNIRNDEARNVNTNNEEATVYEKLVQVYYDSNYSNRRGYDEKFLGTRVPLPEVTDLDIVSRLDNGKHVIPYEHFSIVQNRKRRLALFTASNVSGTTQQRRPGTGDYSRDGLTGIHGNDAEKWITDDRIPVLHQLPDKFYTKDRQAFDKGHLVRREDVCWGKSYTQIRRANGDTYHTTNCSPQVAEYNRSNLGGMWGKLENLILSQATKKKNEDKYTLFSGPVFAEDDEWFEGYDDKGPVKIQIPQRYWKIVVDEEQGALRAFAFVLEQDLSAVRFEEAFVVNSEFKPAMINIRELENMLHVVRFPQVVHDADQFETNHGDELLHLAEIKRYELAPLNIDTPPNPSSDDTEKSRPVAGKRTRAASESGDPTA